MKRRGGAKAVLDDVPRTYMSKIGIHSTILSLCTTNVFLAHDIGFARI